LNGRKGVVIGITPKSGANPLAISQRVKSELNSIKANMPDDLTANLLWDDSKFIKASIHEVYKTIIEAIVFVLVVVFLFLGSLRTLSIPAVTIPLSLVGGFALMYWLGYSLNTLTLLALVLAIGMVVDDAIVVAENIHRHIESGENSYQGAIKGAREIQFAVISITVTLAAVYAPIGFMTGLTGQLFQEFAFTLAGVVIISGIIALTLSPMMCSKLLKPSPKSSRVASSITRYSHKMIDGYRRLLSTVMSWRVALILLFTLTLLAGAALYRVLPDQLAPKEDQGLIFSVAEGPAHANLNYTQQYTRQLTRLFRQTPEITNYGVINGMPNGTHSAMAFSMLKPWSQRQRSLNEILTTLRPKAAQIPGMNIFPLNPYTLPGIGENQPIQFIMQSTGSYQKLAEVAKQMKQAAQNQPGLVNIDTTLKVDKPVIDVNINRAMAADLDIPMQSIGQTLNIALGDFEVGRFARKGRSYYVIPQLSARYRHDPSSIESLYLKRNNQKLVQLGTIANADQHIEPRFLPHFQQLRSARLKATIIPGFSLGQALERLKQQFNRLKTDNMDFDYAGVSRHFVKAQGTLDQTLIFAILFIYLVLAAQFESFLDPLLILLTVPLSTTGGLALLAISGGTLNIYTQIGLVTLVGLISKHGILLVEFANQLQHQGYDKQQAALEAAALRLRPILMTTASMVLSATPLVLATGAGAYSRYQMGLVLIGGMVLGTILTLFVIPAFYSYIGSKKLPVN
jgi:multidrug efflux pump